MLNNLRIRTVCVTAALAALLVTGVPVSAQQDASAGIQALLDTRAQAVREKDRDAFLTTVHPEFRREQETWFERSTALAMSDYSLTLDPDHLGEFTRDKDREAWGEDTAVLNVRESYRLVGYDPEPDVNELIVTFARQDGWKVSALDALDDLGVFSDKQIWDTGPVESRTSEHFMFLFHPADASQIDGLIAQAEASVGDVDRAWSSPWHKDVAVYVPSSSGEVKDLLGATFDVSSFVAFAVASLDDQHAHVGNRIIINPTNFLRHSQEGRRTIFAHELLHVATRPASGPFIPVWVEEGLAQLTEGGRITLSARGFDGRLPENLEFISGGTQSIVAAYGEAHSAMQYMRETFGLEKVEAFYRALGASRLEPGTSRYHTDLVMQQVLGIPLSTFEAQWAASVRG